MKFGRNLVAGLQEHRDYIDTLRNDLSVKQNKLENTRNPLIRLGKRVRELRIRRLGVRIPSRAQESPLNNAAMPYRDASQSLLN